MYPNIKISMAGRKSCKEQKGSKSLQGAPQKG